MSFSRAVELGFSFLAAFLALALLSFFSSRPMIQEINLEARADWDAFRRAVAERNDLLPGMVEGLRGFQPGHAKLSEKILDARAASVRATDQDTFVAWTDLLEGHLTEVERIAQTNPALDGYPPFGNAWKRVRALTSRIRFLREDYARVARLHNRLIKVFPQNMFTALFGFVPLKEYPTKGLPG